MKKHLPTISRVAGILLILGVLAFSAYYYYTARHAMNQFDAWKESLGQTDFLHDTYYVAASPTYLTVMGVTLTLMLGLGLLLLSLPHLIIKFSHMSQSSLGHSRECSQPTRPPSSDS